MTDTTFQGVVKVDAPTTRLPRHVHSIYVEVVAMAALGTRGVETSDCAWQGAEHVFCTWLRCYAG